MSDTTHIDDDDGANPPDPTRADGPPASPNTPSRVQRWMFRAPIKLFDWHLDGLLRGRFVLLEHTGRRSGAHRRTALEVVDVIDGHPVIASGFGTRSDWYHNVTAQPDVTVTWRRRRAPATARRLDHDEATELFVRYQRDHARAARGLAKRLGVPVDRDPSLAADAIPTFELVAP